MRPPIERIPEILEALFLKEPALATELLEVLGRADRDPRKTVWLAIDSR